MGSNLRNKRKIVVAMSGGVDSSVTAGLLLEEGHQVEGVSLRLWEEEEQGPRNCSDHRGAREVAELLGIPHALLDLRARFRETVVKSFARSYLEGRTPNPCVACNRDFKLGALLEWARERGADYVATGHYARIARDPLSGTAALLRGADRRKDQSYFLFDLSQQQLASTLFPLGSLHKGEVRRRAKRLGLPVAERPESQDICFSDYKALVESCAQEKDLGRGEIVDRSGQVLGYHKGIHRHTIGQRRGLGVAASRPLYVVDLDETTKRIVVGGKDELSCAGLVARSVHWIEQPEKEMISAEVQVRYRSPAVACRILSGEQGSCEVRFEEAFPSVTPGQAAVFYQGDRVLGGGWIEKAIREEAVSNQL